MKGFLLLFLALGVLANFGCQTPQKEKTGVAPVPQLASPTREEVSGITSETAAAYLLVELVCQSENGAREPCKNTGLEGKQFLGCFTQEEYEVIPGGLPVEAKVSHHCFRMQDFEQGVK